MKEFNQGQTVIYEGKEYVFDSYVGTTHGKIVKQNSNQSAIASLKNVHTKEEWEKILKEKPNIGIQNWIAP